MLGELSTSDFIKEFDLEINLETFLNLYNQVKLEGNKTLFRSILYGLGMFLNENQLLVVYRMFLIDKWHNEHEELVMGLQNRYKNNPDNLDFIKSVMLNPPEYICVQEDIKESFIKKCSYAIVGHTDKKYVLEVLRKLSMLTNELVKKYANYQLERLKVNG